MLIPKLINTFLFLLMGIFFFSIIFFMLDNLPRAHIEIKFMVEKENLQAINLCNAFKNSEDLKNSIVEIYENKNVDYNKNLILERVQNYLGFKDPFEIVIGNVIISSGKIRLNEVYRCYIFDNSRKIEIIIKL